ncbi:hypothetical protein [Virgisporangium aurantiacum]|uniref:Uncharacterized protein n=1 Tax=Virgisporangium aurantiacum TaxID=175570 RepID=A0A8J3ZIC9_9ACTN|nr:hypothetical protein [Virgisporangium aurantiacum]GIJ62475.1 hypothetical protein Vau01_099910 [Virgisporangium aurantiacum]
MDDTASIDAPAIACDMTDAPDTAEERMAEYDRLFTQALAGRDRTGDTVRLRFRADEGVEAWVRDLAAREKACCPFYDFAVSATADGEVWWDVSLVDGVAADEATARTLLDTYYHAPDYAADGVAGMTKWLSGNGFAVTTNESGTVMRFGRNPADAAGPVRNAVRTP